VGAIKSDLRVDRNELERAFAVLRRNAGDESAAAFIFDRLLTDILATHHRAVFWGDRLLTLDKSAAFKDDWRFKQALEQVNSSTGANQYTSPDKISWRLHTLVWAASCALKIPGDFVECGVFRGDMSWVIAEAVDLGHAGKKLYAYDTFEGFDPRYSSEADFPEAPQIFQRLDDDYRSPDIYESVVKRFAAKPYVKVIRGAVPDVLRKEAPSSVAFLHLDMNSPSAERAALEVLFERMSQGAIIVFDDYGWVLHRKQKEAADEFMNEHGYSILELPTGQGLAVLTNGPADPAHGGLSQLASAFPRDGEDGEGADPGSWNSIAALTRQSVAILSDKIRAELNTKIISASRDIQSSMRDEVRRATIRIPGRRYVAFVAAAAALTAAVVTAAILVGAHLLRI
jgi:O-methyltransferase